jgi:3-methyl-2-oxobutanoate hydroxymethyltransferase
MSRHNAIKRFTAGDFRKGLGPYVCLTAATAPIAALIDHHCDLILVGDSLAMVLYGMENNLNIPLDMMIAHGRAVVNATSHALVMVDMPFGTYQESKELAFRNAVRIMQETGAGAIKIEGGEVMAETISFMVQRGIPVCSHIGVQPQSVNIAGYRAQGQDGIEVARLRADALALADAGAFAMVIEGTFERIAREITELIAIPTIGIGASPACDGQILVTEDMLGLFSSTYTPRFAKRYAHLEDQLNRAVANFAEDVRSGRFPTEEHCFGMGKGSTALNDDEHG